MMIWGIAYIIGLTTLRNYWGYSSIYNTVPKKHGSTFIPFGVQIWGPQMTTKNGQKSLAIPTQVAPNNQSGNDQQKWPSSFDTKKCINPSPIIKHHLRNNGLLGNFHIIGTFLFEVFHGHGILVFQVPSGKRLHSYRT